MPRLSKRLLDQLRAPAGGGELFVWDDALPGFGVRMLPSGRKTYLVQYRDGHGRTRRYALGMHGVLTVEQARRLAQEALARVRAGENPAELRRAARQAVSVAALAERFLREEVPKHKPKTQQNYRLCLHKHLLPALGTLAVPAVTTDDLAAVQVRLADRPYQANRVLSLARTLFQWAEVWQMRPAGTNPAKGLKHYPEKKRERYLTAGELARLGAAMAQAEVRGTERPEGLALIRLLLLTGARVDEMRLLRWEWVDWRGRCVRLPDSKTGPKTLYLSQAALEVLEGCDRQARGLVLEGTRPGMPQAQPKRVWTRLCRAAGISGVRPHDLRHTYASLGVTLGLSLPIVGRLLGHTEWATTQRYAHLAADPVQQAAEQVGEAVKRALGG